MTNPASNQQLEPCKWCAEGNKPDFLDSDGTKVSITGNDGILSHAYDVYWWPCLKFGVEIHSTRVSEGGVVVTDDGVNERDTFANSHFQFGPCAHSMVKPDCASCLQGHASRIEMQIRKLEASTALPLRERIERVLREHLTYWRDYYRGVPPSIDGWVNNALHSIMWGIDRDLPLAATASPAAPKEEAHRCPTCGRRMQSDFDPDVGMWYECHECDYREAVSSRPATTPSPTLPEKQPQRS